MKAFIFRYVETLMRNALQSNVAIARFAISCTNTTYRNTYRYINVLPKFVRGYNDTVHSACCMAPSKVTNSNILAIWNRTRSNYSSIRRAAVRFRVGQHVRISKEKLKFAKGGEENYTTEICRIHKVVRRIPCPVYELQDLLSKHIDGQFYAEKLSPVHVTIHTTYAINKILRKRVRRGILEYLVRCRGYSSAFDTWIKASSVKHAGGQNHFQVTLLSNDWQTVYPANTLSSFTTCLAQPIYLGSTDRLEVVVW